MSALHLHHQIPNTAPKTKRSPHYKSCEQLIHSPYPRIRDTASLLACTQPAPPAQRGCGGDQHGLCPRVPDGQEKKVTLPLFLPGRFLPGAWVPTAHPQGAKKPQSLEASELGAGMEFSAQSSASDNLLTPLILELTSQLSLETSGTITASGSTSPPSGSPKSVAALSSHELCGSGSATIAPRCHSPSSRWAKLFPISLDVKTCTVYKSILLNWAKGVSLWSSHSDLFYYWPHWNSY